MEGPIWGDASAGVKENGGRFSARRAYVRTLRPLPMHHAPPLILGLAACAVALGGCAAVLDGCETDPARPDALPTDVPRYEGDFALVDDGRLVPAFVAFRDDLQGVVARRDTAALLALVAPDARLSFGDDPGGTDGFATMWFSRSPPGGEPVWSVLDKILAGGSAEEDGAVTVPFVPALWPSDLDPFATVAVVGDVSAFSHPDGAVVATLSDIALPIVAPPLRGWWQVRLPDGRPAYVSTEHALSPVGYRAVFWDDGDGWRLRSFLAGD